MADPSQKPKPREREDESTRKIDIESTKGKADDREVTQDLDLTDIEVLADRNEAGGKVTSDIVAPKKIPPAFEDDEDDDIELPGLGSKLKRLAKRLRKS